MENVNYVKSVFVRLTIIVALVSMTVVSCKENNDPLVPQENFVIPETNVSIRVNPTLIGEVMNMIRGSAEQRLSFSQLLSANDKYYIYSQRLREYMSSAKLNAVQKEHVNLLLINFTPETYGMISQDGITYKTEKAKEFLNFFAKEWVPKMKVAFSQEQQEELKSVISNISTERLAEKGLRRKSPDGVTEPCTCGKDSWCSCPTDADCQLSCSTGSSAGCGCFWLWACNGRCTNPIPPMPDPS